MEQNMPQHTSSQAVLYNEDTESGIVNATRPIPEYHLPEETRSQRYRRIARHTLFLVIRKVDQLLSFALNVLLLILFIRFLLIAFNLTTGIFTHWIYALSIPFIIPFENFIPQLHYGTITVDLSTLAAMLAYVIFVALVRRFCVLLFTRP